MNLLELKVREYLERINQGRELVVLQKAKAKSLFTEAQNLLGHIPGGLTTVNTVMEMWTHEDYERKHLGPRMIMREALKSI